MTLSQDQPEPQKGFGIDPGLDTAITMAPTTLSEDSCLQAILKFWPHNGFDSRIGYEPQED